MPSCSRSSFSSRGRSAVAPLVWSADSIFRAESGHGADIGLDALLTRRELRRLRRCGLPAAMLLGPATAASGFAARFAEFGGRPGVEARHRQALLAFRLETGNVRRAAAEAARAGRCRMELGESAAARRLFALGYGLHRLAGRTGNAALCLELVATLHSTAAEHDSAEARLLDALAIHRRLGDDIGVGRVLTNLGVNRHQAAEYGRALDWYLAAREHARDTGIDDRHLCFNLGMLLEALGSEQFVRLCAPTLDRAEALALVAELEEPEPPASGG